MTFLQPMLLMVRMNIQLNNSVWNCSQVLLHSRAEPYTASAVASLHLHMQHPTWEALCNQHPRAWQP